MCSNGCRPARTCGDRVVLTDVCAALRCFRVSGAISGMRCELCWRVKKPQATDERVSSSTQA
eukprot:364843-Chlamydomonas_euryale.AAC.7